ncbi:MAG: four helix bundle protein [Flavobacteriaceae bacterium]|jgi:four helix bundle protein|nr:four helix bundle protein [Flavobacteriaceae bacterium]
MKIEKFEDILSWQKSRVLAHMVYRSFDNSKDSSFKNQIERASISVMNNIAEGFERKSNQEFKYFLFVAKGSCAEVRSMSYIAHDLNFIDNDTYNQFQTITLEISKLISGLIKKL